MEYKGEFQNNWKYNGKGYNHSGNILYQLIKGNENIKLYDECC